MSNELYLAALISFKKSTNDYLKYIGKKDGAYEEIAELEHTVSLMVTDFAADL